MARLRAVLKLEHGVGLDVARLDDLKAVGEREESIRLAFLLEQARRRRDALRTVRGGAVAAGAMAGLRPVLHRLEGRRTRALGLVRLRHHEGLWCGRAARAP